MERSKRIITYCVIAALSIPAMIVAANAQQKPNVVVKEWRIPTIYFLSGPMAGICEPHKWLTERLIAEINAAGGISGKPIVTEFLDSALDPTKATACMAKAIDAGALCTHGPLNDMEMRASMPLAVREGIFSFSGTCTDAIAKQFFPWTIYSLAPAEESVKYQMELWFKHEPGIKSAVGLEEPIYPMVHTLLVGFNKTFESLGVKTNGIIEVPSGMADYTSIVVRALGTGADTFTIGATGPVGAKLVKGLVSRGVNPKHIYLEAGFLGPEFLTEAKGSDEGVYSATSPTYAATPEEGRLIKAYRESHGGRPWGGLTPMTWDMLHMIKAAFEHQGITGDPAKLKEERIKIKDYAINQKGFKGLDVNYDVVNGLGVNFTQRLFQIRKDEAMLVEEFMPKP
jgi:branched-chain amino acid transport system substrate-binding protein